MKMEHNSSSFVYRLTALWAFSECALGGILHAFKFPFTGFFLGGFAVIMIGMIAFFSLRPSRDLLVSTLIVVLIKAAVNPHSPPMAYVAVGFQGLCGALLYSLIRNFSVAAVVVGALSLAESALQKVLVTTLIFGKSFWQAVNIAGGDLVRWMNLPADLSPSEYIIWMFTLVYTLWGIVLGRWLGRLPLKLEKEQESILQEFDKLPADHPLSTGERRGNPFGKWMIWALMLTFILITLLFSGDSNNGIGIWYLVIRTVSALFVLYFILPLLIRYVLKYVMMKRSAHFLDRLQSIQDTWPQLGVLVKPAYRIARMHAGGLKRYSEFVFVLIVLGLYRQPDKE